MASPPDPIDLSLNEVEGMALKAARGSGLPWGVAEDVGRAAAWMAGHAGEWAEPLLGLLEAPPARDENPLLLAGLLADGMAGARSRTAERVVAPAWVVPGVLLASGMRRFTLRLGTAEIRSGATATCPATALADLPPGPVVLRFPATDPPGLPFPIVARFRRSVIGMDQWRRLDALAQRTYVPASDDSRRRGAGGARLDDD